MNPSMLDGGSPRVAQFPHADSVTIYAPIDLTEVGKGNGGFVLLGRAPFDNAGFSVGTAGDVNGDGLDDILIGTRDGGLAGNLPANGEAYVVFGRTDGFGSSIDLDTVAAGTGGFALLGRDQTDRAGGSVAGAGDINGDGYGDLIVGAPQADSADNARPLAGESYVIYGRGEAFAASIALATIAGGNGGFVLDGEDAGDQSGIRVSGAGDINGDGFDDLLIGASGADGANNAAANAGDTYVIFGKAGSSGTAIDLASIAAGSGGFVIHGADAGDGAGVSVASAGDINSDGYADLVIGAGGGDGIGNSKLNVGETYVVYGRAGGFVNPVMLADIAAGTGADGFVIVGRDAQDQAGLSVASAGDLNGDGFDDLVVGAPYADVGSRFNCGESYVIFGSSSGFDASISLADIAAGDGGFVIEGRDALDHSGISAAAGGDINGDGFDDLIIGADSTSGVGNLQENAGEAYVLFGKAGGFAASIALADIASGSGGFIINASGSHQLLGTSVASAGDVNGDGFDDLVIGAPGADADGVGDDGHDGTVYVVFGRDFGSAVTHLGTTAADSLVGSVAADIMVSGRGNDTMRGGAQDDALSGGAGDDVLEGGAGADRLDGGNGDDTVDYASSAAGVALDLMTGRGSGGDAAGDSLDGFENAAGSGGNDTLSGDQRANVLDGRGGNDSLSGGAGTDTLIGGPGNDTYALGAGGDVIVESAGGGRDTVRTGTGFSLAGLVNVENLVLTGNAAVAATGNDLANSLTGNGSANTLSGGAGSDTLTGAAGPDSLDGGTGQDSLVGGMGTDTLAGGPGNDLYVLDDSVDTIVELPDGGVDTVRSSASFSLASTPGVENLVLQGNAAINGTGNGRANTIQAGAGNNLIDGGGGLDTVDYAGASAAVTVSLAPSTAQATGGSGTDTILHVERLSGSRFDDTLSGNALANVLRGGSGADSLAGGAGNDTLVGGPGNDTLSGSQGADVFLFESATGAGNVDDIVFFSAVEDTIHLDRTVFAQLAAGTPLSDSQLLAAPGASAATAAGQRIIYDTSTGALYYDADGNASGFGAVRFAILDNHPALTAADILVVP